LLRSGYPSEKPAQRPAVLPVFCSTRLKILPGIILLLLCASCTSYKPAQTHNVCDIFRGETAWYKAARKANKKWGTPIGVMMAIIRHESSFRATVRPERPRWWFIPLPRRSSAYGYAQAQDAAWQDYQRATGNSRHKRNKFGHAINFVGWYTDTSQRRLGISKWDPQQQYLAYHEGWTGYKRGSYRGKPTLLQVARKVDATARNYNAQLASCKAELDKKARGWFG